MVIIAGSENGTPSTQSIYRSGLVELFAHLRAPGRQFVLLGQNPGMSPSGGPSCLAAHQSAVQACSTPESQAVVPYEMDTEQEAANQVHAKFINVIPWLCTKNVCPQVIDNFEVYEDPYHFTSTYANYLSPVLQVALGLSPRPSGTG
jgi:hypothetical protein